MSSEELERKEKERREKKLYKQLEKQQKKLASKGIHVDIESLKKDYEIQRAGGKSSLNLEAALAAAAAASGEEIDVVGGIDDSMDANSTSDLVLDHQTTAQLLKHHNDSSIDKKKISSPFSIESLLAKRQLSVAVAAAASMKANNEEENNNPPMVSPNSNCSSPSSMASPSSRYLSPSSSPNHHHNQTASSSAMTFPNFPLFSAAMASAAAVSASTPTSISHELSLLKPITACPTSFPFKFDPSKISFDHINKAAKEEVNDEQQPQVSPTSS